MNQEPTKNRKGLMKRKIILGRSLSRIYLVPTLPPLPSGYFDYSINLSLNNAPVPSRPRRMDVKYEPGLGTSVVNYSLGNKTKDL